MDRSARFSCPPSLAMKSFSALLCLCAFAVLCVMPASAQVPIPYSNCGSAADHLKIINATVSVWPLVAGQRAQILFQGVLDEAITADGTYSVQVRTTQRNSEPASTLADAVWNCFCCLF